VAEGKVVKPGDLPAWVSWIVILSKPLLRSEGSGRAARKRRVLCDAI